MKNKFTTVLYFMYNKIYFDSSQKNSHVDNMFKRKRNEKHINSSNLHNLKIVKTQIRT